MFQHVILAQSVAALCLWIWRQMACCQQRRRFCFPSSREKKSVPGELAFCFSLINKMLIVCNYLQHYMLNRDVKWLWQAHVSAHVQDCRSFLFLYEIASLINLKICKWILTIKKAASLCWMDLAGCWILLFRPACCCLFSYISAEMNSSCPAFIY